MDRLYKKIVFGISLSLVALCFLSGASFVSAQVGNGLNNEGYHPLAPLPQTFFPNNHYDLSSYLQGMFRLLIALATVFAMIMIIWGGIEYMSTDAISGKEEGKERIQNAVWGLILALVSWLILYTINPDLLQFKFFAGDPTIDQTVNNAYQGGRNTVDTPYNPTIINSPA